jgi:transcriptional regulator with PAS, ATPase and Fis domain
MSTPSSPFRDGIKRYVAAFLGTGKINIFLGLVTVLTALTLIPILVLFRQSMDNLETVKVMARDASSTIAQDQTAQIFVSEAQSLAERISDFLRGRELDVVALSRWPRTSDAYLEFSQAHSNWIHSPETGQRFLAPLYKEIAYIDKSGQEAIKIVESRIVPPYELRNVSDPANTTYKSERYFVKTRESRGDIYVSHLTGWYVSRQEQLKQAKTYEGVIRFCKRLTDRGGAFSGIVMIALDHRHLMNFIVHRSAKNVCLLDQYKKGEYTYLFDNEGWAIAHPKVWDIRGVDRQGHAIDAYDENTPKWKVDAGLIPLNLLKMDWRLRDIYTYEPISNIVNRVLRGETIIATIRSLGIADEEGKVRQRVYAPIYYDKGEYAAQGIFGGVVVGTALETFLENTRLMETRIEEINKESNRRTLLIASAMLAVLVLLCFAIARRVTRSVRSLNQALVDIGRGNFAVATAKATFKEVAELSRGVQELAQQLKVKDEQVTRYTKDLEIVNAKLAVASKELDSFLAKEYQTESDEVLEEKIRLYERQYPRLLEIRESLCIGNNPQFLRVLRQVVPISQMTTPAWIAGEPGVGKTALARVIHLLSPRSARPYYVFTASEFSAADPMIVMGKLFGYGAGHGLQGIDRNGQVGVIEECDKGTLLIDDIDALPLESQAQLLRVVDGLSFHPAAGKPRIIYSDVRFIFATNADLENQVARGLFRKDLFRRMGGSINRIEIPPLRERRADIPLLASYFLERWNDKMGTQLELTEGSRALLISHDYAEGNLGDLKMLIELACESARMEGSNILTQSHFPALMKQEMHPGGQKVSAAGVFSEEESTKLAVLRHNHFRMEESEVQLGYTKRSHVLSHHLRGICLKALMNSNWNITQAAQLVTGVDDGWINELVIRRMEGYLKNIAQKKSNARSQSALYKNLPREYHAFVKHALDIVSKKNT